MLSEIFMVRLEALARASLETTSRANSQFVPFRRNDFKDQKAREPHQNEDGTAYHSEHEYQPAEVFFQLINFRTEWIAPRKPNIE